MLQFKPQWANAIVDDGKTWEIRGEATTMRGKVRVAATGLARKIIGEVTLVDCLEVGRYDAEHGRFFVSRSIGRNIALKISALRNTTKCTLGCLRALCATRSQMMTLRRMVR